MELHTEPGKKIFLHETGIKLKIFDWLFGNKKTEDFFLIEYNIFMKKKNIVVR